MKGGIETNPNVIRAITLLHETGIMSGADLRLAVPELNRNDFTTMRRGGMVKVVRVGLESTLEATDVGRTACGISAGKGRVVSRLFNPTGQYDGADLRPFTGRPGSEKALALKSHGVGC